MLDGREISLGLLNLRLKLLQGTAIGLDVDAVLLLEELDEMVSGSLIEVLSSEMSVTGSGEHLEHTVIDGEDGNIKGSTTEIEDQTKCMRPCQYNEYKMVDGPTSISEKIEDASSAFLFWFVTTETLVQEQSFVYPWQSLVS